MSYRGFHSQADHYDFNRKLEREYALIEEAEEREAKERARAYYDRDEASEVERAGRPA